MSFDAGWLDLRAPADAAARDRGLLAAAAAHLAEVRRPLVVDLGCGTGATVRAFGPLGLPGLRWRLVDNDPGLLAIAGARCGVGVETVRCDFADPGDVPLAGARLVTASALLDLVSAPWIEALGARLAGEGIGLYAALNYDGRMAWAPAMPGDAAVRDAFNAHQRRDKGFGPALGPAAPGVLAAALTRRGFAVRQAASPWRLGPGDAALQAALALGIARAAGEMGLARAADWGQARRAASGSSSCTVGHFDVLALPPAAKAQSNTTSAPSP